MAFASLWCGACTSLQGDLVELHCSSGDVADAGLAGDLPITSCSKVVVEHKALQDDNDSERSTGSPGESLVPSDTATGTIVPKEEHRQEEQVPDWAEAVASSTGGDGDGKGPSLAEALACGPSKNKAMATNASIVRSSSRLNTRSDSGLIRECASLPIPAKPQGKNPLSSKKMLGIDLQSIRTSLEADEGPVQRFMAEVLGCTAFVTTPWATSRHNIFEKEEPKKGRIPNIFFRRSKYRASLPTDIPPSVAKLVGIPDSVDARSLFALGVSDTELVLVQQSNVQGIMFSDRFRLQNTFRFTQDGDDVLLEQWAEVKWSKPLPWTHTPVKLYVEKKARAEAKDTFGDFARIICQNA
jgi:hypothetical protein